MSDISIGSFKMCASKWKIHNHANFFGTMMPPSGRTLLPPSGQNKDIIKGLPWSPFLKNMTIQRCCGHFIYQLSISKSTLGSIKMFRTAAWGQDIQNEIQIRVERTWTPGLPHSLRSTKLMLSQAKYNEKINITTDIIKNVHTSNLMNKYFLQEPCCFYTRFM